MPDLSGASWPSELRVPSGKSVTIPPARSRRRVSLTPEAPIPSRWIGNEPTDLIMEARPGTKRVDLATKLSWPPQGDPEEEHVQVAQMVGDQQDPSGLGHMMLARRPPPEDDGGECPDQILDELIPDPVREASDLSEADRARTCAARRLGDGRGRPG